MTLQQTWPRMWKEQPCRKNWVITRSSWLNCALRDDEAVYWVSIGHYEAVAVGNWWYWVSRGHLCLYILHKVEIWKGVTHAWRTDSQTLKDRATQLLMKYKSGALVTQSLNAQEFSRKTIYIFGQTCKSKRRLFCSEQWRYIRLRWYCLNML